MPALLHDIPMQSEVSLGVVEPEDVGGTGGVPGHPGPAQDHRPGYQPERRYPGDLIDRGRAARQARAASGKPA